MTDYNISRFELKQLKTDLLDDHPDNPRLIYRDDVIEAIAANLNGEWPKQHALIVRPVNGRYQIIAGHQRKRAAHKAKIETVWCWVGDLSDEDAYMELASSNAQRELSPLEIGMHVLHCKSLNKGGRGKKGGLSAYAKLVGKTKRTLSEYRNSAEVLSSLDKASAQVDTFLDKAKHFAAIHKLPKAIWSTACDSLIEEQWSAKEVSDRVANAKQADFDSAEWAEYFPKNQVMMYIFNGGTLNTLERHYSDVLLIFLLKTLCPDKYGERRSIDMNAKVNQGGQVVVYLPDNGRDHAD